jgi:periplasmic divalent cation tolerance protein
MDILSLATTVGNIEDANRLARALVAERLAACVQVDEGVRSHYRWQGKACEEPEVRLTVKSLPRLRGAIEAFLAEHHPYELPQLLWHVDEAAAAYADWVCREVSPD